MTHDDYDHLRESADAERTIIADLSMRDAERACLALSLAMMPYIVTYTGGRYVFTVPTPFRTRAMMILARGA